MSVMGHAVLADDAGAVDAESDREVLNRHVMDNFIKTSLQECGIDAAERADAVFGQSAGECHGMPL